MSVQAVLAPLFAQVFLTFGLLLWMGRTRFAAVRAGQVTANAGSPRAFGWPDGAQKAADSFHNQLELPPLFALLVALALITKDADLLFVAMSWIFVASRVVHAVVHNGANRHMSRFRWFALGAVTLILMWIIYAVRVLVA
ncbi:MAPEG family protein [Methylopila turkensis]|uniref:MAPEG family protein n=1 Tax=Methylopila turkensis TaxID=1437816 RepID=A0A9W6JME3_9HYPH|nr:MAPEG family protein [Methylopila turkensis]GLK79071.1 hypothetical protein GCM10008174_08120 [Methylopila turkensis]